MAEVTPKASSPRIRSGGAVREVLDRIGDKWSLLVIGTLRAGPLRLANWSRRSPASRSGC
jgi:DNA-binding HxlR family transcriptional regulator